MVKAKQDELTYMYFTVFDSDGITPLTGQAGSCTSSLRKSGAATAEVVSIAEIGSTGRYYASFTPLAVAQYDLEVTATDDRVIGEPYEVESVDLDDLNTNISGNETKIDANQIETAALLGLNTSYESTFDGADNHATTVAYSYDTKANLITNAKTVSGGLVKQTASTVTLDGDENPATIAKSEEAMNP